MKKLFALLAALCLLCACLPALAETLTEAAEGTVLELEGFSLKLDSGMLYSLSPRQAGSLYLIVYPYSGSGDTGSNFSIAWSGGSFDLSAGNMNAMKDDFEAEIRETFASSGLSADSFECGDAYETTFAGADCCAFDVSLTVSAGGSSPVPVRMRQLSVGSAGYVITFTTNADVDALMDLAGSMLAWN